jgi:hypothetical protein
VCVSCKKDFARVLIGFRVLCYLVDRMRFLLLRERPLLCVSFVQRLYELDIDA